MAWKFNPFTGKLDIYEPSEINGSGIANEIAYWTNSDTLSSLTTITYPSLIEFSYLKGITSSIQLQLDGKQVAGSYYSIGGDDVAIADGGTGASTIINARSNLDVYSTSEVDNRMAGVAKRSSVRVSTTINITIATALNDGDILDGVTLADGDLVLVKNQTATEENGIYVVDATPSRDTEFDTYNEIAGSLIAVNEGTSNTDSLWLCTSNAGGVLETTAIAFSQMQVSGELIATNNLSDLNNVSTAKDNLNLGTTDSPQFTGLNLSGLTALELVATDASKNLQSLDVAIYPSLTELPHVKGVTSAIQTQLDAKQGTLTNSAGLLAALDDETGTGLAVFSTSPTFTTSIGITGVDPEARLTDTGDSEYTRITRSDTSKKAQRFNRVTKPGSVYPISNLVAQWKMNDNAANTTVTELGGLYNGALNVNTDQRTVAGKIGTALSLNGTDWIEVTDPNIGSANTFTICAWIYPTATGGEGNAIVSYADDAANRGWKIQRRTNGTIAIANTVGQWQASAATAPLNTWTFICGQIIATWNDLNVYINGVLSASGHGGDSIAPGATDDIKIGRNWANDQAGSGNMFFSGRIDDVRYYNKVLSATEISKIYNDGAGTDEAGLNAASTVEADVWSSQDGQLSAEEGIQTYGDSGGRTILDGKTLRFNINGSEIANINASGFTMIGSSTEAAELLEIEDGLAVTGLQISNTATDGDPILAFALSGTKTFTMGLDDGDGDKFKIGTTAIGTNTRLTIDSAGLVGIGTDAPTHLLDINSDNIRIRTAKTPASATDTGTQGQVAWDANFFYVCTATNTWVRAALTTW